jgi:hypothetical protein
MEAAKNTSPDLELLEARAKKWAQQRRPQEPTPSTSGEEIKTNKRAAETSPSCQEGSANKKPAQEQSSS